MTPREIIGRAIYDEYDRRGAGHTISWGAMGGKVPHEQEPYLKMADAISSDLEKLGFTIVPKEPTESMCEAGARFYHDSWRLGHAKEYTSMALIWEAMLNASAS